MKKHYTQIDIMKGIAILMVLIGHSIIVYPINLNNTWWCYYLHHFVSSTHMPLFFALSGFCFSFYNWKTHLTKKGKRLLIPFFAFGFSGLLINVFLKAFVNNPKPITDSLWGILTGKSGWFLYTLFLIFLIFPLIRVAFETNYKAILIIIFLGILQFYNNWPHIFNINNIVRYIFYFSIGYYFKVMSKTQPEICDKIINLIQKKKVWLLSLILWCTLVLASVEIVINGSFLNNCLRLITSFIGIINIISFSFIISKNRFSKLLEETGKISLQLFLFNGYFLTIARTLTVRVLHISSPIIIIAVNLTMMYLISFVFIQLIVKQSRVLRILTGMV